MVSDQQTTKRIFDTSVLSELAAPGARGTINNNNNTDDGDDDDDAGNS